MAKKNQVMDSNDKASFGKGKNVPMKVKFCACVSAFQDALYGLGKRAMNPHPITNTNRAGYRCTVCGSENNA